LPFHATPPPPTVKSAPDARVQVVASFENAILVVVNDIPTATQRFEIESYATPCPETLKPDRKVTEPQLAPLSEEVIILFEPSPTATHVLAGPAAIPRISPMIV